MLGPDLGRGHHAAPLPVSNRVAAPLRVRHRQAGVEARCRPGHTAAWRGYPDYRFSTRGEVKAAGAGATSGGASTLAMGSAEPNKIVLILL